MKYWSVNFGKYFKDKNNVLILVQYFANDDIRAKKSLYETDEHDW